MTKVNQNFTVYQGEDRKVTIYVVDSAGSPKTMTGGTPAWYAMLDPGDPIADAILSKTGAAIEIKNGNGINDAIEFIISDTDSKGIAIGSYYHEAWVADATGKDQLVAIGWMTIRPSAKGTA